MTDARLPGRWLTDPTMDALSDRAWRTFTGGLMWSNEAGTDGLIPARALRFLHPRGVDGATASELVNAGLWEQGDDSFTVPHWKKRGQELASVVEQRREDNRLRQAAWRDKEKAKRKAVTRDVTPDVGQEHDRTRTGTGQADTASRFHKSMSPGWPVREIPRSTA